MNSIYERYAIAWLPEGGSPLARFGAHWTGWCSEAAERRPPFLRARLPVAPPRALGALCRTGLHAAIRPAFRLQPGRSYWKLEREMLALSDRLSAFTLPRLAVAVADGRVILAPTGHSAELERVLDIVNRRIDRIDAAAPRAPLAAAHDGRGAGQRGAGRFALALTGKLPTEEAERLARELAGPLEPLLAAPQRVDDLALLGDPGGGRPLRVLDHFALTREPRRAVSPGSMDASGPTLLLGLAREFA